MFCGFYQIYRNYRIYFSTNVSEEENCSALNKKVEMILLSSPLFYSVFRGIINSDSEHPDRR